MNSGPMANAPDRFLTWRWEDDDDEEREKLSYIEDSKTTTRKTKRGTFTLRKEDHTLGNLIRIQLLRDEQVRFAGYRIPHPLIFEVQLTVETVDEKTTPTDVLLVAIDDLKLEVEAIGKAFEQQVREHDREF